MRPCPVGFVHSYMWLNVAVASWPSDAPIEAKERDRVANFFSPEQLAEAQALATTCFNSNFTDCGEPD